MSETLPSLLYRWPNAARFGRRVPKERFYEHGTVTTAVREKFISQVQRITWAYKLAEATIHLPRSPEVPEIQVFQIDAKRDDVPEPVLAAIDKAILFPVIFEISRHEGKDRSIRMSAAHKELGSGSPKLSAYYSTGWQSSGAERQPLPAAISLTGLYTALLEPLTQVPARSGESVSQVADRLKRVRKLEREVTAIETKIRNEPQFNRKIELRRQLKTKQAELAATK